VKRTGRGQSIGAALHICMRTTQGISLWTYLYFKQAKVMFFVLYIMFFFLQNRRRGGQNRFCPGRGGCMAPDREGRWQGKRQKDEYGANNVYTCM
jgi:hypothetical protein